MASTLVQEEAFDSYFTIYDELLDSSIEQIKKGVRIVWNALKPARLIKIWTDYSTSGVVRDEKGIEHIANDFVNKIIQLKINTYLMGHTSSDPQSDFEERGLNYDALEENICEYVSDKDGGWIISDFAVGKLDHLAVEILGATESEKKLLLLDRVLNVIHRRSDLSEWFVVGGRATLTNLSE